MYMQRRLLYHRLIDDESGTYITDYVQSAVGFVCSLYLIQCVLSARFHASRSTLKYHITKTTYCIILLLLSYSTLALFAALVHEFLQTVRFYAIFNVCNKFEFRTVVYFFFRLNPT